MDVFDAISHSFSTIAIGGFSTHDASIGYFNSPTINVIIGVFLLISGCNFALHFSVLTGRSLNIYWRNHRFRMFIFIQLGLVIICSLILWLYSVYDSGWTTINQAFFQVVSMATTAGFATNSFCPVANFFTSVTVVFCLYRGLCWFNGGIKSNPYLTAVLQGSRELKRLVHPNAVYTIKLGHRALPERIIEAVWGFFSAYALVFIISLMLLIATGVDEFSAFSAIATTLNNLGPGLGIVADNFTTMNPAAKWILVVTMLFGRLEVFTLLVLFTPTFLA